MFIKIILINSEIIYNSKNKYNYSDLYYIYVINEIQIYLNFKK